MREAQALARVRHPSVVAVHDIGTWNDRLSAAATCARRSAGETGSACGPQLRIHETSGLMSAQRNRRRTPPEGRVSKLWVGPDAAGDERRPGGREVDGHVVGGGEIAEVDAEGAGDEVGDAEIDGDNERGAAEELGLEKPFDREDADRRAGSAPCSGRARRPPMM